MKKWINELEIQKKGIQESVMNSLEDSGGLLRLAPCWVPRSFLHPGRRIKLHPSDIYAYGLNRGGIDERWFASTTEAANEGRVFDEGLSYAILDGHRVTLKEVINECGAEIIASLKKESRK